MTEEENGEAGPETPENAASSQDDEPPPRQASTGLTFALLAGLGLVIVLAASADPYQSAYGGIGILLFIPAALGALVTQLFIPYGNGSPMGCFVWPTAALLALTLVAYLVFGEGAICIAMVLPLWIPAAIAGGLVNFYNTRRNKKIRESARLNSIAWLAIPLIWITGETAMPPQWESRTVVRDVVIDAAPEAIWPLLISIPDISAEEGRTNFTQDVLGVPRPSDAKIITRNGQSVRIAHWGAGLSFEERISKVKHNAMLGWNFSFPDDSIQQHTDRHISPNGPLLKIQTGQYELTPIGNGKTRLRLTTDYSMRTRLSGYFGWWGEILLGDVQSNVLTIIKERSEA